MKIPLNWLKDYVKTNDSPRVIADSFTQLGLMLDKPLDDSGVLDLEHRMDRSDWLSVIGCARDYAAFSNHKLHYPTVNTTKLKTIPAQEMIEIKVETPHVRRFNTRLVKNVKVGQSPTWLKERLEAYGIKSINNVVDITNYCMVEYGQPMHAQDIMTLKKPEITIRSAQKGESITTILGTKVNLDPSIFVLTSGGIPTVIGGIVGGKITSVTDKTTDIILDAGNYDQAIIRKTSRKLKIINETVSRYDKFLSPKLCEIALDRATYLLMSLTGATVYHNYDYYPNEEETVSKQLTYSRLKKLSGLDISVHTIKRILTALEYQITKETKDSLTLNVPYFRTDVEVEDDIIADILRINNYNTIPEESLNMAAPIDITPSIINFEEYLRDLLVSQNLHEHITTTLVKESDQKDQIKLSNALSSDQNALRTSNVPMLRLVLNNYAKHQLKNQAIFEIGKVFSMNKNKYLESRQLAVVASSQTVDILSTLMHQLGISYLVDNKSKIISQNQIVGELGHDYFTLDPSCLMQLYQPYTGIISDFDHTTTRDLSLIANHDISYFDIASQIKKLKLPLTLTCKQTTKIGDNTNYLITLSWSSSYQNIQKDLTSITNTLKSKLGIISKS